MCIKRQTNGSEKYNSVYLSVNTADKMKFVGIVAIFAAVIGTAVSTTFIRQNTSYAVYYVYVKGGPNEYLKTDVRLSVISDEMNQEMEVFIGAGYVGNANPYGGDTFIDFINKVIHIRGNGNLFKSDCYSFSFPHVTFAETLAQLSKAPPGNGRLREVYCDFGRAILITGQFDHLSHRDACKNNNLIIPVNHCKLTENNSMIKRSHCLFSGYPDKDGLACILGGNFEYSEVLPKDFQKILQNVFKAIA